MKAVIVFACGLAAGCATAPAADAVQAAACGLTVRFGSYAMGIDGGAAVAVERLLRADRGVNSVERKPWGREGEFDLCARTRRVADARRLSTRIRGLLPARPRGPITVTLADGGSYSVPAN
jgi:hypothetical protein